ncbi:hypothetical protein V1478_016266 [Vespula squamosa]|uniref:Uncharacterized protein n=1 Tax=Vespula squamosa TaxID=30214 RepID=A0ABD1ZZB8_VESSQ
MPSPPAVYNVITVASTIAIDSSGRWHRSQIFEDYSSIRYSRRKQLHELPVIAKQHPYTIWHPEATLFASLIRHVVYACTRPVSVYSHTGTRKRQSHIIYTSKLDCVVVLAEPTVFHGQKTIEGHMRKTQRKEMILRLQLCNDQPKSASFPEASKQASKAKIRNYTVGDFLFAGRLMEQQTWLTRTRFCSNCVEIIRIRKRSNFRTVVLTDDIKAQLSARDSRKDPQAIVVCSLSKLESGQLRLRMEISFQKEETTISKKSFKERLVIKLVRFQRFLELIYPNQNEKKQRNKELSFRMDIDFKYVQDDEEDEDDDY